MLNVIGSARGAFARPALAPRAARHSAQLRSTSLQARARGSRAASVCVGVRAAAAAGVEVFTTPNLGMKVELTNLPNSRVSLKVRLPGTRYLVFNFNVYL